MLAPTRELVLEQYEKYRNLGPGVEAFLRSASGQQFYLDRANLLYLRGQSTP